MRYMILNNKWGALLCSYLISGGSSRDFGISYDLMNNVIVPNLGKEKENRILVVINQADVAIKRYF